MILGLLALDENYAVVKAFLHQMNFEIFSKNFNFATQIVIWALNKLKFTLVFVLL